MGEIEEQRGHTITAAVAVLWSLFQLSVASWWILDATLIRTVHLAFAMLICFLEFPFRRSAKRPGGEWYVLDVCLSILAALSALYLALDYGGIVERYGAPNTRDLVMGILLVVLLIEGDAPGDRSRASGDCRPVYPVCVSRALHALPDRF